jgi:hypothetical protein
MKQPTSFFGGTETLRKAVGAVVGSEVIKPSDGEIIPGNIGRSRKVFTLIHVQTIQSRANSMIDVAVKQSECN